MSINIFHTVKEAISHLNPHETREEADRPVRVALVAQSELGYRQMEAYFTPALLSAGRRAQVGNVVLRVPYAPGSTVVGPRYDIEIYSPEIRATGKAFTFNLQNPDHTVAEILKAHPDLELALARHICPFREPVATALVKKIAKENAMFSLATAIPDIIPFLTIPWTVGEFASDTAVLTANQIRLAFLLAGASDREIGYREQKGEIATILLGAFGWRAIARELVGKIPFGGGLIPKAAVAYAGTRVAGMSLERYYRIGYHFTRAERQVAYQDAFERGKTIAGSILQNLKRHQIAPKSAA